MKIFMAVVEWYGDNCFSTHIEETLVNLGHKVESAALGHIPENEMVNRIARYYPDAVIVFLGHYLTPETINVIRQQVNPLMVLWENDDPWRFEQLSLKLAPLFDLCVTNDPWTLDLYRLNGISHVLHLPFGCNPRKHFPSRENIPLRYEISFVGSCYENRVQLLSTLKHHKLAIWGDPAWQRTSLSRFYQGSPVRTSAVLRQIYHSSKINLNIHYNSFQEPRLTGTFTNQRPYEILACKGFCLTDWRSHSASEFIDRQHLVFFRSPSELSMLVDYYLDHREEKARIALHGYALTQSKYTYAQRLVPLLEFLER